MNLIEYLNNGQFETFIPGNRSSFALGQNNPSINKFLDQKGATSFIFISFNDFSTFGPIDSPEAERAFLDSQEEAEMSLLMKAGTEEWWYYLAGFRSYSNWGNMGGILVLDADFQKIKKVLDAAGYKWLVKGAKDTTTEFITW